ncbi:UbiX family flavin prenyltransferase [Variovorax sp.]|uniref:UbiX family flavin prenyltransferase n=1 Tax=Variovorax sp. TaxID=1871043 RepID=UPI002D3FB187|nr:UbiX family flavin prenyltransferase [Variovorax sp.]HYP84269.1 UbiX family flavin prenyltransferase [Variovorax sp.]
MTTQTPRRLIVAITGASGFVYGYRLLQLLRPLDIEVHLVVSRAAQLTMACETRLHLSDVTALADKVHRNEDIGACVASGSYRTLGMVVAPCSMKTLAEIASGTGGTLVARAADVMLKERRRLVLLARETPLTLVHLRNMTTVTEMGAIVAPPVPAFYAQPENLDQMVDHTLGRVLDLFDIDVGAVRRWTGPASGRSFDEAKPTSLQP